MILNRKKVSKTETMKNVRFFSRVFLFWARLYTIRNAYAYARSKADTNGKICTDTDDSHYILLSFLLSVKERHRMSKQRATKQPKRVTQ